LAKENNNSTCRYLTENNLCAIYEDRPIFCNVEMMFKMVWSKFISEDEFYKITEILCDKLCREIIK